MGYGDGVEDYEPNHSFGSSWRDSTGESNYENTDRRYDSTRRRAGFGRDAYGIGYGGDWEPEANRRRQESQSFERNRFNEGYSGSRRSRDYPSSEGGFYTRESNYDRNDRSWWDRAADEVSSWFGGEPDRGNYDDRWRGHRGRGPKNYTRSDDRIREDINDRLTDHDYVDASEIDVQVNGGEVVLTGTVNSRRDKRMAEDIVEDISGVKNVENRLRVSDQQSNYAGRNWGYAGVTGHTELNRQEANATQGETPSTQDQSRTATSNR
jgi:osmotically-inducible protein OsmY